VSAPDGVAAGRGYSQAVTGRGRLVVVSGQIAQDERGDLLEAEAWALVDD
jgi:enamine deaminase RidA (YjgF/YER057c/UK114 family)